ncbi:unnamed protein product, partial [Ectocarpus sp. 13 AM-2016]
MGTSRELGAGLAGRTCLHKHQRRRRREKERECRARSPRAENTNAWTILLTGQAARSTIDPVRRRGSRIFKPSKDGFAVRQRQHHNDHLSP